MKKLLAVIIAIVMMFSMASVSFAKETSAVDEPTNTIDNYVEYLEAKLDDTETNIFVKMLAKIVLVFIHFGFIKAEDFEDWFDNTAPEDKEENTTTDNTENNPDASDEWEDGAELELYHVQSLPIQDESSKFTITEITVTKNHFEEEFMGTPRKYKYMIQAKGHISDYLPDDPDTGWKNYGSIVVTFFSDTSYESRSYGFDNKTWDTYSSSYTIDEEGNFVLYCEQYNIYNDYDTFMIQDVEYHAYFDIDEAM